MAGQRVVAAKLDAGTDATLFGRASFLVVDDAKVTLPSINMMAPCAAHRCRA